MFKFLKKKKEEIPLQEGFNEPISQPNFQEPSFNQPSNLGGDELKDDLILSKIETINAKLDNVIQRLERIERLAKD
ncbi:MAG: hypothetical protein KJ674_03840 [Nanoarchaeota archaeon]|nr:hypothetical protein [Nanoarchaeota archaeon]